MGNLSDLKPFIVMDILREASRIEDCIHMEIGEPDLEPPPAVYEYLERAVKDRKQNYTPALGLWELREKIAEHYYNFYGIELSPSRIAITPGTSGAFLVAYAMLLDGGKKLGIPDPSYPCYRNIAKICGGDVITINTKKKAGYKIVSEEIYKNFDVLHISSPVNPTGAVYGREDIKSIVEECEDKGIVLISDEIYHGLVYEGKSVTALEFSDRVIVINGFSKYFCMPGFRLGWIILPENMIRTAEIIIQNVFISAPTLSQYAALGAFDYDYLEKVRETFKKRRDLLYRELGEFLEIPVRPEGAFYIWAKVDKFHNNSFELSKDILKKAKVAVTPGIDFGDNDTHKYIRLAYTRKEEELKEGAKRLKEYFLTYDNRM